MWKSYILIGGLLLSAVSTWAAEGSQLSIKELMEAVITPATDTLWGASDAPSDEDWRQLEQAAIAVIVAGELTAKGGSGPQDDAWAKEPAWQALNQTMVQAAKDARMAARNKNLDALFSAGEVLYPPCESCHQIFNPGVVGQQ